MREKAITAMREYFASQGEEGEALTSHTLEVLRRADQIIAGENVASTFVRDVALFGALFHDIGIPESKRKYRSAEPRYQHTEGPPITRQILSNLGVRSDIIERVCYIVGNHHIRDAVDGQDFQIVYEADYLVNTAAGLEAGKVDTGAASVAEMERDNFTTATGVRLLRELFNDRR